MHYNGFTLIYLGHYHELVNGYRTLDITNVNWVEAVVWVTIIGFYKRGTYSFNSH